jgi:hypothetical protein
MSKMKISSPTWNRIALFGSLGLVAFTLLGLFGLQQINASASLTLWFVVLLGVAALVLFAGPGIAFVLRKRIPALKKRLPGGTLAWVRMHLYLPILAIVAGWMHASSAPFRNTLSSGKLLLALGIIISVAGIARHHLIGVTKAAVNADAQISKIAASQPRSFRQLVIDYKQLRRPLSDIMADAANLPEAQQAAWAKVVETQEKIDHNFPRGGSQSRNIRMQKLLRAVHAPLTVALFLTLGFHVVDVLGVSDKVLADDKANIASVDDCAGCHSEIVDEWARSSMAHAQTGTIMEAQLPVTLTRNEELADLLGEEQEELYEGAAQVCVNCHAPIGAVFIDEPDAVLPFNESTEDDDAAVTGGGEAINQDGVSCQVCHTQTGPLGELAGAGPINVESGTPDSYGTVFGPLFDDPNPLPVRVHDIGDTDPDGFWNDPIATSIACGACHNVKLDIDGDGLSTVDGDADDDDDGDLILNENELDFGDDGALDDLVLQTTFDEWQDYVEFYDDTIGEFGDTNVREPLGCIDCHMPSNPDQAEQPVVDYAPGMLPIPDRPYRSHSFIGVDYDLEPEAYSKLGLTEDAINDVIAERRALLQSAVTLETQEPFVSDDGTTQVANVVVTNNLMGHVFPTGFAFARQFWLEVSAVDQDGNEVCLVNQFEAFGVSSPCASGVIDDRTDVLPQCDPVAVAELLGVDRLTVPNGDIDFAEPVEPGDCDPWLANFQKILSDGDPDGDGVFREVTYQSFLADIVRNRFRIVDGFSMAQLQSTRLVTDPVTGELFRGDQAVIPYEFAAPAGTTITVTATMHFRHLPPEFIRGLAEEQESVDNLTPSARIDDPDELVDNLVVTEVVTAESGEGVVLACEGPQNRRDATILSCIEPVEGDEAVEIAAASPHGSSVTAQPTVASASVVGIFAMIGAALVRPLRLRRRNAAPATT